MSDDEVMSAFPPPWRITNGQKPPGINDWWVVAANGRTVAGKDVLSRIVASVNACADVSIELLDQWNNAPADVIAMRAKGSSPAFLTALIGLQFAKVLAENVALREALAAWYETRHTTITSCDDAACTHLICRALRLSEAALKKERP